MAGRSRHGSGFSTGAMLLRLVAGLFWHITAGLLIFLYTYRRDPVLWLGLLILAEIAGFLFMWRLLTGR